MQQFICKLTQSKYFLFGLFAIAFILCIFNAWGYPIFIVDEARNSACAMEMLTTHNWFVPTYNYDLRTDKPPLHYFFMMLAYKTFGINVFAARFFSAIFGALTITMVYLHSKRWLGEVAAFWSAFILLSSIHFVFEFHLGVPDPYLIFFFTGMGLYFYKGLQTNELLDFVWMYVFMSLGILSKGPIAILLPGLIFLVHLLVTKRFTWTQIKHINPLLGLVIVLGIATPWFIINGIQTDWQWSQGFFFKHNVGRFSSSMEGHHGPFFLPTLYVLLGLFPFSFIIPQVVAYLYNRRHRVQNYRLNHNDWGHTGFILFCTIAAAVIIVFFSVSNTKLIHYTIPAYPFLAIMTGYYLSQEKTRFYNIRASYWAMTIFSLLIPIAAVIGMQFDPSLADIRFYALALIVMPLGMAIAFFLRHELHQHLLTVGITTMISGCIFFGLLAPKIGQQDPVQQTISAMKGHTVGHIGRFAAAYPFYHRKKIIDVPPATIDAFFDTHPDGVLIGRRRDFRRISIPQRCDTLFIGKDVFEGTHTVAITLKKRITSIQ